MGGLGEEGGRGGLGEEGGRRGVGGGSGGCLRGEVINRSDTTNLTVSSSPELISPKNLTTLLHFIERKKICFWHIQYS